MHEWLAGAPTSEEPLMNRLTAQFTRRRRHCDVGVRIPIAMTSQVAFLHRQGKQQTDAYGSDLAITVEIPDRNFRKTALFQIKVSEDFCTRLELRQLKEALTDSRTKDRSFLLVADKARQRLRVKAVVDAIPLINGENKTGQVDCTNWMSVSEWLTKWISCNVGAASDNDESKSVEKLLQAFVVEPPSDWEMPWGIGDAADYSSDGIPARAWLEMFFRQLVDGEKRKS